MRGYIAFMSIAPVPEKGDDAQHLHDSIPEDKWFRHTYSLCGFKAGYTFGPSLPVADSRKTLLLRLEEPHRIGEPNPSPNLRGEVLDERQMVSIEAITYVEGGH